MQRAARASSAPRLRSRRGRSRRRRAARAFLDWLLADNYVLLGIVRYSVGPDGLPHPDQTSPLGVFKDPTLLPVVFPGLMEVQQAHLRPADDDDRDHRHRLLQQRHGHPPPGADRRHRHPRVGRRRHARGGDAAARPPGQGRVHRRRPQDIPLLTREARRGSSRSSGDVPNSHAYREIARALQPLPQARAVLRRRRAARRRSSSASSTCPATTRSPCTTRHGAGLRGALDRLLATCATRTKAEEDSEAALAEAFGPISFSTLGRPAAPSPCSSSTSTQSRSSSRSTSDEVRDITERVITTWEDRVARDARAGLRRARGPAPVQSATSASESRSGLYRESTPPEEVPEDLRAPRAARGPARDARPPAPPSRRRSSCSRRGRSASPTRCARCRTSACTVREELRIPLVLPDGRHGRPLRAFEIEAPPASHRPRWSTARTGSRGAARARTRSAPPTMR